MQETKQEKKARKKAYKKARGKATRPWKALTWISGPLAILLSIATVVIGMFDNTFSVFVGGNFYTLENEDENAVYYESDFATTDEMVQYGLDL